MLPICTPQAPDRRRRPGAVDRSGRRSRPPKTALGDHRGAVVAIDPHNGDVLALASKPGFDPALFARGLSRSEYAALADDIDKPLLNRALRGTYPSGSTIKPVIALAGLTYHVVDPDKQEFCAGVFHLPGSSLLFREGKTGRHGWLDLAHAIAKSCDVYFYGLAATSAPNASPPSWRHSATARSPASTSAARSPGLLPSPEWKKQYFKKPADQVWFPGETVNFGVGQGYLLVTPLQLAHVASVLAERGKSFRPRLVTGVRDGNGQVDADCADRRSGDHERQPTADWDTGAAAAWWARPPTARPPPSARARPTRSPARPARRRCSRSRAAPS